MGTSNLMPRMLATTSLVGPRGPAGAPGVDSVPAEEAVTAYVENDTSSVAAAVDARIGAATGTVVADLATETNRATAAEEALHAILDEQVVDVLPNGIIEGRSVFTYGPSRGVGVTAQRIHFDRIWSRIGSGFHYNGCTGGYFAADAAAVAYGAISHVSEHGAADAWTTSSAVSTWINRALWGGLVFIWPFGADARDDGLSTRNSTTAKARAGAATALHAFIALVRAQNRVEANRSATYSITNGSPTVVGLADPMYRGMLITATGVPANTYVGEMINGGLGGFKLSSSRTTQVDINATATNASASLTFSPVYTGTIGAIAHTGLSGGLGIRLSSDGATSTYVIHLTEPRRVQWVTAAIDDAEYVATAGAPFGGNGGAGYSITVNGGAPITGTTSNKHRFGALNLCWGNMAVDLGVLPAGANTIAITASGTSKVLVDDTLLIESLTPPTVMVMKEVQLPAAYYALFADRNASWAKTQIYNGIIDSEIAVWPNDQSVIAHDITADIPGYDPNVYISSRDGAYAHFNDPLERRAANSILKRANQLPARPGLIWT
ncbi:hypothetical protein [Nocardioides sp. LML1-1-1.1]|uniref:hypothetical protein n=1 Tax=Nocardioides sp. LML1-1-1.1 TaxID=3135248 RepID=UPI0034230652